MADTKSRNSIFFVALPSLLLAALVALMGAAYSWRIEPGDVSSASPPPAATGATASAREVAAAGTEGVSRVGARCGTDGPLAMDQPIRVQIAGCRHPLRLHLGNLRIGAMWGQPRGREQPIEAVIRVHRRGRPVQTMRLAAALDVGLMLEIGTLDRAGNRYVMVQSFGQGPRISVDLAIPEGPDRGVANLGVLDMTMLDLLDLGPTDIDGDGRTDFIIRDDRFSQEFDALNGSAPPPLRIWNIRRGRAVEVSAQPRFRFAFQQDLESRRAKCLQGQDGIGVRSSCPGYVATAARLGRFRTAWRDLLRVYDRSRDDSTMNDDFTDHLRRFLRTNGYLRG